MALDDLRTALTAVDDQLVELIAERQRLVEQISARKLQSGTPTRDFQREKEVLSNAGRKAKALGLPPRVAEEILGLLIETSLTKLMFCFGTTSRCLSSPKVERSNRSSAMRASNSLTTNGSIPMCTECTATTRLIRGTP